MTFRHVHEANSYIHILEEELEQSTACIANLAAHCATLQQSLRDKENNEHLQAVHERLIAEAPRNIELMCEIRDDPNAPLYLRLLAAIDLLARLLPFLRWEKAAFHGAIVPDDLGQGQPQP